MKKHNNALGILQPRNWLFGNTLREIARLHQGIDDLIGGFAATGSSMTQDLQDLEFSPPVDVEEKEKSYLLSFDLPGVKKEDVKIEQLGGQLLVSGERKQEKKEGRHYYERSYGSFQRSFTLPEGIKAEEIKANYHDGVLSITLPKSEAAISAAPKTVEISEGKGEGPSRVIEHKEGKKGEKAA